MSDLSTALGGLKSLLTVGESVGRSTSPNARKMAWTDEQQAFLAAARPENGHLYLEALAGTGKTSCLLEYARRRPGQQWNLVVFNKSIAEETRGRAPRNLTVSTGHALAYARDGHGLVHKISNETDAWLDYARAAGLLNGLDASATDAIRLGFESWVQGRADLPISGTPIGDVIRRIWAESLDPQSGMPISHDIYLRRFCLRTGWRAGNWMLDEAQDWTPAWLKAWLAGPSSIIAGDDHQTLYDWRGADGLSVPARSTAFALTASKRSPNGVAGLVNSRLRALGCRQIWSGLPGAGVTRLPETPETISSFSPDVILGTRWARLRELRSLLMEAGVPAWLDDGEEEPGTGIRMTTVHRVKGETLGKSWIMDGLADDESSQATRRRLQYVALTRHTVAVRVPEKWRDLAAAQVTDAVFD